MILVGSTRGGSRQLAQHLMSDANDHVTVHSVDGFIADDVEGALQEMYAISRSTKATKFMFSVSFSPPSGVDVTSEHFDAAIAQVEAELNIQNQPKVVVLHSKGSRPAHAHCIWSRINTDTMTAIELGLYKKSLNSVAKDIYIENNWQHKMPKGFLGRGHSDPRNFNLKEWQQAERHNLSAKQIKSALQQCWKMSDNKKSFNSALNYSGFFLARGDKRGFVAVDWNGEVYSLSRSLGVKAKDIKQRLGEPVKLPSVDATKAIIKSAQSEAHIKLKDELTLRHKYELKPVKKRHRQELKEQRLARVKQHKFHEQRQQRERDERQKHYRRGFKGLFDLITGKRREMKRMHEVRQLAADNRDWDEKNALIKSQLAERQTLQTQLDVVKARQQRETMRLNADFIKTLRGQELKGELKKTFNQSIDHKQMKPIVHPSPELRM